MSGEKLVRLIFGFFVAAWVARHLGPEKFGVISYCLAFVYLFNPLTKMGMKNIQKKYFVKHPDKIKEILDSGLLIRLFATLLGILTLGILTYIYHRDDSLLITLISIFSIGLIFNISENYESWFEFNLKSQLSTLVKTAAIILSAILKIIAIVTNASLITFMIIYSFELVFIGIALLMLFHKSSQYKFKIDWNTKLIKTLFLDSLPLVFTVVAMAIYMRIDQIMIKHFLNDQSLGQYSVAIKLIEVFYIIPGALTNSAFADILKVKSIKDNQSYKRKIQKLFASFTYISLFITLLLYLLSSPLITLIFGDKYDQAISILSIYSFSMLPYFWNTASAPFEMAENILNFTLIKNLTAMIINLGLNYYLIPIHGIKGAAYATLVSSFSIVLLNLFTLKGRELINYQIKSFNLKFLFQ